MQAVDLRVPLSLPNGSIRLARGNVPIPQLDRWFTHLKQDIQWQQPEVTLFGKQHKVPRLTSLYGSKRYVYSGTDQTPNDWTRDLCEIKEMVELWSANTFNSVLLNKYRDGSDAMGWHADNEPVLGADPIVVSLSLGAARRMRFKHRLLANARFEVTLYHGDLLMMGAGMQQYWQHAIPRQTGISDSRISLTFRDIRA